jgi:hypothetical protein
MFAHVAAHASALLSQVSADNRWTGRCAGKRAEANRKA